MITRVRSVTVYVSDQDKALDFYVNKLGFEKLSDSRFGPEYRWIEVAPPGAETVVILAKGYGDWSEERVGQFAGIVFEADDIQATYETLRDRGVHFTEPPERQPWGMMQAIFGDQDGNTFVLVGE
ncbi:MAG: VOC family protein [Ardenticatenaceae bacterium]|nr:VOC family protein [Ardenticatenaceae bacterium]HBY94278.1 hypothetical protein [Chloroflexota bacterium]